MLSAVLSIGKEIVSGIINDTNSFFISSYISHLGIVNRFISSVDDNKRDIIDFAKFLLDKVDILITTGGLGPTFDDITLESMAEAIGSSLYLDEDALNFIDRFYTKLYKEGKVDSPHLNEKRKKMAYLIQGCKPLKNIVGAAWGVYIKKGGKHIFCLPGVPKEMKPMFENEVIPILEKLTDRVAIIEEYMFNINDESVLGVFIDKVMKTHDVYIKSLPSGFENKEMKVRFTAYGRTEEESRKKIKRAVEDLRNLTTQKN